MSKPKYVSREIKDLKDMLEQTVALHSENDAFIKKVKDTYVSVSYKKYKEDVCGLGTELLKRNMRGEKLILLSENRYEWCVSFMATVCNGGIAVPIIPDISEDELISRINLLKGKFIIFSEKYRELIKNIRKKCPTLEYTIDMDTIIEDDENLSLLRLVDLGNKAIANGENNFFKLEIDNEEIAGIFYGDTIIKGKGVMVSHKNLVTAIMGLISFFPISHSDKTTAFLSFSDISYCICNFLVMINQGGTIRFAEKSRAICEALKDTDPTIVFLSKELLKKVYDNVWLEVGNMPSIRKVKFLMFINTILTKFNIDFRKKLFRDILKNFGKNLNLIVFIGNETRNKILRDFSNFGLDVVQCYEVLEASSIIMVNTKKELKRDNIIGEPLPGIKAFIFNKNNKFYGDIIINGDNIMKGYYEDRKATKKIILDEGLYIGKTGYRDKSGCFYSTVKR